MVLHVWAGREPEEAFRFFTSGAEAITTGDGRTLSAAPMLTSVLQAASFNQPERAFALMAASPDRTKWPGLMLLALVRIADKDPQRALQLSETLEGDTLRLQTRAGLARTLTKSNPALAEEIRRSLPGERSRSNSAVSTIWRSGYDKPAEAAALATTFEDPIVRSDAMHSAVSVWLDKKPLEAVEFAAGEMEKSGNPLWLRALADSLLDRAGSATGRAAIDPKTVEKLTPRARENLSRALAAQPASAERDRLLDALR